MIVHLNVIILDAYKRNDHTSMLVHCNRLKKKTSLKRNTNKHFEQLVLIIVRDDDCIKFYQLISGLARILLPLMVVISPGLDITVPLYIAPFLI